MLKLAMPVWHSKLSGCSEEEKAVLELCHPDDGQVPAPVPQERALLRHEARRRHL